VGHGVTMREIINAYEVMVGQPEGKRPLGRPRRKREHIKLGVKVIGWEDVGWIQLDQFTVLVSQFVYLLVCYYLLKSFVIYETVLSSKSTYCETTDFF